MLIIRMRMEIPEVATMQLKVVVHIAICHIQLQIEIENKVKLLFPGMYVREVILIDNVSTYALPESAVVREDEKYFIFAAIAKNTEWVFQPIGVNVNGWFKIKF